MTRLLVACVCATLSGLLALLSVDLNTDASLVLGDTGAASDSLNSLEGRSQIVAVTSAATAERHNAVDRINVLLAQHPLVTNVSTGPELPGRDFIEALWEIRLVLSPVQPDAFSEKALRAELRSAKSSLSSLKRSVFAEFFLPDPTGSFRRLVNALEQAPKPAVDDRGYWVSKDAATNLIFVNLADIDFDVAAQTQLDAQIKQSAGSTQVESLGPRSISALISGEISWRAQAFGVLASLLLLGWLYWVVRSVPALFAIAVPLAAGLATSAVLVDAIFGSLHVVALGFGATLLGLAIDYPLHLMAHGATTIGRRRAIRLIFIGVVTTAIAFLALIGAGLPILAQMGVLVATGLAVSAVFTAVVGPSLPNFAHTARTFTVRQMPVPRRPLVLVGLLALVATMFLLTASDRQDPLLVLPKQATDTIERFRSLIDLPAAEVTLEVRAGSISRLRAGLHDLEQVLDRLRADGLIEHAQSLRQLLSDAGSGAFEPDPEAFSGALGKALAAEGFSAEFAGVILDEFRSAKRPGDIAPGDLTGLTKHRAIRSMLRIEDGDLVAPVRLYGLRDARTVTSRIDAAKIDGVVIRNTKAQIATAIDDVRNRASVTLLIGVFLGLLVLLLLVRRPSKVAEIALLCAIAALTSAIVSGAVFSGIGVFQIVSLALVAGIAIDYGVFTCLARNNEEVSDAVRSIAFCAITTLIAFGTMSFSGVSVLVEIGLSVSVGVAIMLVICLTRDADAYVE